jgi:glycosyltransferase involved in cell wall biosynthesis
MKTSVLIIAHNEEQHIERCIASVLNQTQKPDEVVVICHNCTDATESIAKKYPITVVSYNGPHGITYARIEGCNHVTGDSILCTDGDSFVARNWVEVMTKTLQQGNVLVGSWMKFKGTTFGWFANFLNKYRSVRQKKIERMIWGPSMAFWGKDKDIVRKIFEKSIVLSNQLGLTRNPDDYWLALFMQRRGKLGMTNKTYVVQATKELTNKGAVDRSIENVANAEKMEAYLTDLPDLLKVLE